MAASGVLGLALCALSQSLPLYFWILPLYFILFVGGYVLSLFLTRSLDREDIAMFETVSEKTGLRMGLIRRLIRRFAAQ